MVLDWSWSRSYPNLAKDRTGPDPKTLKLTLLALERNLSDHTKASLKRREPTIAKLAKTYNGLCKEIARIIERREAPLGAIAPSQIDHDQLFNLDVDDEIWQDIGLDEGPASTNEADPLSVPRWLADQAVRDGIRALLELDRCQEEEARLKLERCALQEWLIEEWACYTRAEIDASPFFDSTQSIHLLTCPYGM